MDSFSTGTLVWVSVQPLISLFLCVAGGFAITKAGLFSPTAAVGAGQIIINVTIPMLFFSKIVPTFNSQSLSSLGPLVLIAVLYEAIGITMSWIIKQLFWVPHRFRYGILVAGGWGSIADIPTAVVMGLMASSPFNGTEDENMAVAYLSVFVLVFCITLFIMGNVRWIEMDYHGPDVEDEEVQKRLRIKQRKIVTAFAGAATRILRRRRPVIEQTHGGIGEDVEARLSITSRRGTSVPDHSDHSPLAETESEGGKERGSGTTVPIDRRKRILNCTYKVLRFSMTPPSLSIIISFIISVVPTLKALFVPGVPGVYISPAPDGQPALAILMNTATFIGGASIPLALIALGSALARLQLPHGNWKSLPFASISALAVARLIIMPIMGVLICQGFTHIGLINPTNNVLRFVCILVSCLPPATTQVYLTQVYSGTGTATHLAAYLIPQYILMFGTMTGLIVYTLHLLFG